MTVNSISSYFSAPTQAAVTAAASWYGSCFMSNVVYQCAPALITQTVVESARRQFGFYLGTIIGNATAPAVVATAMPKLLLGAQLCGAAIGAAVVTAVYQKVQKANSDRAYQEECRTTAADCEVNGRVDDREDDDAVVVNLHQAGNDDDFDVDVLDQLA